MATRWGTFCASLESPRAPLRHLRRLRGKEPALGVPMAARVGTTLGLMKSLDSLAVAPRYLFNRAIAFHRRHRRRSEHLDQSKHLLDLGDRRVGHIEDVLVAHGEAACPEQGAGLAQIEPIGDRHNVAGKKVGGTLGYWRANAT